MNQRDLRTTRFGEKGMKRMSTIDKLYSIKSKKGTQEEGMPTTTLTNKNILPKINPTKHDLATGRDPYRVKIFDTTLRDGEQSPGCTMTADEEIQVAKQLRRLGVDIIEAGFPIASVGDFEAVSNIAKTVGTGKNPPIICGLARALKKDIETCWNAVKHASFPRIHTFIATSDIHMEHKLKKTREEVLEITREMVSYARSLCEDVEFSAEDALRSDPEFLYQVYSVAVEAGATTLNVPDTVGYTTPNEFYNLIHGLRANVKGIDSGDVTISVHGHDDLGMAVANFMSAIEGGARQVECTINGIGERAGNAALEEIVMALQVRKPFYNPNFGRDPEDERPLTNIKTKEIYKSSRRVSTLTGMVIQPNKAIVGANAFAHESGIHQDGMLKNKSTYEIMDATSIGLQDQELVLGKHSGRAAFRVRLNDLGFDSLSDGDLNKAFSRFKEVADKKKEITNSDIISIVNDEIRTSIYDTDDKYFEVTRVQVICGDTNLPTATVGILDKTATVLATNEDEPKPVEKVMVSTGTGPVDAAFRAVSKATNIKKVKLLEFSVSSVTAGIDAIGEVTVRVKDDTTGKIYFGRAANTDIVVSATTAYVNALNRLKCKRDSIETHPQFGKV